MEYVGDMSTSAEKEKPPSCENDGTDNH